MFRTVWDHRLAHAEAGKADLKRQVKDIDHQITGLLERIVDARSPSVIKAYETRVEALEKQRILITEKMDIMVPAKDTYEEFVELSLRFLSNPWFIYEKGSLPLKRKVLKLAFAEPMRYSRKEGFRTTKTTFPFKVLTQNLKVSDHMVLLGRIELPTSPLPRVRSTTELQQPADVGG